MKKNIIYIYTTKTWRTLGYYKIGGTKLSGKIRVEQQDGTSCPEELELVFEIETNLWDQDFKDENGIKQKGIHSLLEMLGYEKTRKRREWFEGFESDEDVIVQVLKVINQNGKITKKYKPYFYKTIIEEKIIDRLLLDVKNGLIDIDFVLELAPRFGKNTFMLNLMKKLFTDFGYTAALLPSYWLSTHSSLKSDLLKYEPKTGFSDHLRYVGRDEDLNQVLLENQGKKMLVIEVSLHENDLQNRLKPLDNIPRNKKVSFQDEVDFGSWKPKQQKQINEMGCGLKFHLTGSNIYKILSTLGDVDDRFFQFSYTDMLLMRDGSHPWLKGVSDEELVEITKSLKDIITPRIYKLTLDTFIDRNNSVPDEFKTKWSKLLSDVNQNQSQLTPLIQSLFGEYDGDFNEMFLNLNVRSDVPMNVSVMFCNTRNQEEQKKLVNLTQSILGDKYVVQVLNSNETSNKKCEDKVSKKVSWCKKNNKKLVLITKDMGSRSFSIPELDTVFLLFDGGDLGVVSQKVSRVLTPGHTYNDEKKKFGNIISLSLDPNRTDSIIDEYILSESEKIDEDDLTNSVKKVLRSIPIFSNHNGVICEVTEDYETELIESSSLIKVGASAVNPSNLPDGLTIDGIKVGSVKKKTKDGIKTNEVKTYYNEDTDKEYTESERVKKEKSLREKLSSIVYKITDISEINNIENDNFVDMIISIKDKGYETDLVREIGEGCDKLITLYDTKSIPPKMVNTILSKYNELERNIIN